MKRTPTKAASAIKPPSAGRMSRSSIAPDPSHFFADSAGLLSRKGETLSRDGRIALSPALRPLDRRRRLSSLIHTLSGEKL
jgi:hypothetical protein